MKIGLHDDANVLDVGCGTGLVGRQLRVHGFAGRLAGLDVAEKRLREARLLHHNGVRVYDQVRRGDANELPWKLPLYDAVASCGMLGLAGPKAFNEMVRVTRPGGSIIAVIGLYQNWKETHRRFGSIVRRIRKLVDNGKLALVPGTRALGSGYTGDRDDEHYELFVLNKPA
jgi:ubiquinone/menaquinone biosynthesis C-methylase UbiE